MIHDYYYFKNVYSKDYCKEILEISKENTSKNYFDKYDDPNKNVNVNVVELSVFKDKLNYFFDLVNQANEQSFGFDLYLRRPRTVNINTYGVRQEYPFHKDFDSGMSDIKLTAILNLSLSPFEGGDFEVFAGDVKKVSEINETGSLLIFPSFLYHRVKPVLSGERITMSCWFTGPSWK